MNIDNMTREELELLSYTDLTYMLLKEKKKTMNTPTIFRVICDLLGYDDNDFAEKIGDYYTSLTIDKRFVMLDNGEWDVCDNHKIAVVVEDDEEEVSEEESDENEEELEETDEENIDEIDDADADLDDDDDLADLSIVEDDEPEEE